MPIRLIATPRSSSLEVIFRARARAQPYPWHIHVCFLNTVYEAKIVKKHVSVSVGSKIASTLSLISVTTAPVTCVHVYMMWPPSLQWCVQWEDNNWWPFRWWLLPHWGGGGTCPAFCGIRGQWASRILPSVQSAARPHNYVFIIFSAPILCSLVILLCSVLYPLLFPFVLLHPCFLDHSNNYVYSQLFWHTLSLASSPSTYTYLPPSPPPPPTISLSLSLPLIPFPSICTCTMYIEHCHYSLLLSPAVRCVW